MHNNDFSDIHELTITNSSLKVKQKGRDISSCGKYEKNVVIIIHQI